MPAERIAQTQKAQLEKMDAMGYQVAEMKVLFTEREVRLKRQIYETCSQMRVLSAAWQGNRITVESAEDNTSELLNETEVSLPHRIKNLTLKSRESVKPMSNQTKAPGPFIVPKTCFEYDYSTLHNGNTSRFNVSGDPEQGFIRDMKTHGRRNNRDQSDVLFSQRDNW